MTVEVRTVSISESSLERKLFCEAQAWISVLVRHVQLRLPIDLSEESLGHVAGQQTVAVLGKHRMIPHPIIHAQANEPAK